MPELGSWVYAITSLAAGRLPAGLRGVADEPVRGLPCTGLTAVVGTVDLEQFAAQPLQRTLSDGTALERLARAHHDVNQAVAGCAATVPFRMATVCLGDHRVRDLVAGHRRQLDAALRHVTGRAEWGVKAYLEPAPETRRESAAGDRSGTAYLMRRRTELSRHERARARADTAYDTLAAHAVAATHHPVQPGTPDLLFNASFLVDQARTHEFTATVGSLTPGDGVRLVLTGPWPAYAFTELHLDGTG